MTSADAPRSPRFRAVLDDFAPYQPGRQVRGRIRAAVVEFQASGTVLDIVVETLQVGDDGCASGGHRFEWRDRQSLAGLGQARIDENGGAPIFVDQCVLIENRTGEIASNFMPARE